MGCADNVIDEYLEVLAGLVHLFELQFEDADSGRQGVQVVTCPHIEHAARCLGMSPNLLQEALCKKTVKRTCARDRNQVEIFKTDRSVQQAQNAQAALVKMIYSRLFEHIVLKINDALQVAGHQQSQGKQNIGILDIYGFEKLEVNSFEQLCINLANERLQEFFRDKVIVAEQGMYKQQGIGVEPIEILSSAELLSAIEGTLMKLHEMNAEGAKVKKTDEQFTKA
eukprot:g6184.t1